MAAQPAFPTPLILPYTPTPPKNRYETKHDSWDRVRLKIASKPVPEKGASKHTTAMQ